MADVTLTWFEIYTCIQVGGMRRVQALRKERPEPHGRAHDYWAADIDGALGECALAKHLNVYWEPVLAKPGLANGDVAHEQVRSTSLANGGLFLHEPDPDDAVFWLALTHALPVVTLRGTILGREGKQDRWWRENIPRPAFLVPQHELVAA